MINVLYFKTKLISEFGFNRHIWSWEYYKVHLSTNRYYVLYPGNKWKYRGSWTNQIKNIQRLKALKKQYRQPLFGEILLTDEKEIFNG